MDQDALNPYAAPSQDRLEASTVEDARYYVVSGRKFLLLYVLTVGLYGLYWDYKQWAQIKRASKGDEWPVARAIFNVFFQHSLAEDIDQSLSRQTTGFAGTAKAWATPIVVMLLAMGVLNRMSARGLGGVTVDVLSLVTVPVLAWLRLQVQRAANAACGDSSGRANAGLSAANIVWMLFGTLVWLLLLIGLFVPPLED